MILLNVHDYCANEGCYNKSNQKFFPNWKDHGRKSVKLQDSNFLPKWLSLF